MKFSDITLEDKNYEALELIHSFSKSIIANIDTKLKEKNVKAIETPYVDLMVESYFSVQAFCVLMKEGLVSSATAIIRIILEQVSICYLLSKNKTAKEEFIRIKQEQNKYYLASDSEKDAIKNQICSSNGIKEHKLKQYFDYGWYKTAGCKAMNLKSICEASRTKHIYDMVDVVINGFVHGQRSVYQFRRQNNGLDYRFLSNLYRYLFDLFFFLVSASVEEYGENVIGDGNKKIYSMVKALYMDIKARQAEEDLLSRIKSKERIGDDINQYYEFIYNILFMLDKADDKREKYLLSQAYLRLSKQVIVISSLIAANKTDSYDIDTLETVPLYKKYKDVFDRYNANLVIPLPKLLEMVDIADDDWGLGEHDIDYAFTFSINTLLETIRNEIKKR